MQPGQTDEEVAKQNGALGIYELEGDTLKVCAAPLEKGRPTEFAAKAGTDRIVFVLKREKPKEAKADAFKEQIKILNGTWVVESVVRDPREKAEGEGKGLRARNTGVRAAQGDILFFLDGDDLFLPMHLAACLRALHESACDFVKTGVRLADPVHPDWKPKIEFSIVINLCVRRRGHDFVGGFPDYHVFQRVGDDFVPQTESLANFGAITWR